MTWLFHRLPIFLLYNVFTHEKKYSHDWGVARKRQGCVKGLLHYEAQKDGPFRYLFYITEMNPSIPVVCFSSHCKSNSYYLKKKEKKEKRFLEKLEKWRPCTHGHLPALHSAKRSREANLEVVIPADTASA